MTHFSPNCLSPPLVMIILKFKMPPPLFYFFRDHNLGTFL